VTDEPIAEPAPLPDLAELVATRRIMVCCGTGGVGKTTTAASIAIQAARLGRRSCVVTIDPARRLADALGLDALGNQAGLVAGDWPGELWALMLDPRLTFDELVERYAGGREQAETILSNRLYRNLAGALSGTQEYMAMEKLYELHESGRFDLIVVDTPPTRRALDFLDAPNRLGRLLDNRVFKVVMAPTKTGIRVLGVATSAVLRSISRVVGSDIVSDTVAFFAAFEGMERGFRDRSRAVLELLSQPESAFILVSSPRQESLTEALFFAERLKESEIAVQALVVNRVQPGFGRVPDQYDLPPGPYADLVANLTELNLLAEQEETELALLREAVSPAPVCRVPVLSTDVHDLAGLSIVGTHLFGGAGSPP
jgi:anion-transporting  ArsA/GET3 family ATPase